jgi:hypothetical protein
MTTERNQLFLSLPFADPNGEEFEAHFLGKTPACPLTADLIALAQGQADAEVAARVRPHLGICAYCSRWFKAYTEGWEETTDDSPPNSSPQASLLDLFSAGSRGRGQPAEAPLREAPEEQTSTRALPPRATPPSDGPSSVVLTGIFTMLLAGRTEEALQRLRPYLPEILKALRLDPLLADRLWEFILDRLQQRPARAPLSPGWLREFAQGTLPAAAVACLPESVDLDPVLARGAIRAVQTSPEEPAAVRDFLGAALEKGVQSPLELDLFRLSGDAAASRISDVECRFLIKKIRKEQNRVARLFVMN